MAFLRDFGGVNLKCLAKPPDPIWFWTSLLICGNQLPGAGPPLGPTTQMLGPASTFFPFNTIFQSDRGTPRTGGPEENHWPCPHPPEYNTLVWQGAEQGQRPIWTLIECPFSKNSCWRWAKPPRNTSYLLRECKFFFMKHPTIAQRSPSSTSTGKLGSKERHVDIEYSLILALPPPFNLDVWMPIHWTTHPGKVPGCQSQLKSRPCSMRLEASQGGNRALQDFGTVPLLRWSPFPVIAASRIPIWIVLEGGQ